MIVTIEDIRLAGYCVTGAGKWFERNGIDFREFLRHGMPSEELVRRGDALAARVVALKKARESDGEIRTEDRN